MAEAGLAAADMVRAMGKGPEAAEAGLAAADVVRAMGKGINLGNTFDKAADYPERQTFERNQRMIDMYADKGFTNVRIPVTWGETFDSTSDLTSMVTRVVK